MLVRCHTSRKGLKKLFELANQGGDLHAMHQGPIFQGVKLNSKATAAGHLFFIEKTISLGVCTENLVDPSIFIDIHYDYSNPLAPLTRVC